MTKSIPGFREEEIAHLSPSQREKLRAERKGGTQAARSHQEAVEYAREQNARLEEDQGKLNAFDADTLVARRVAEHKLAAERAERQQELNAAVNARKEVSDHAETVNGRGHIPGGMQEHVADAAADLTRQRVEQVKEIGLTNDTAMVGHPEATEGQAEAAQANAEKEVADREEAQNYSAEAPYQGATGNSALIVNAEFDDNGDLIEPDTDANKVAAETGAENNGQANQTSEPNTSELALEGTTAPQQPKRRGRNAAPRAVGDGPVSE